MISGDEMDVFPQDCHLNDADGQQQYDDDYEFSDDDRMAEDTPQTTRQLLPTIREESAEYAEEEEEEEQGADDSMEQGISYGSLIVDEDDEFTPDMVQEEYREGEGMTLSEESIVDALNALRDFLPAADACRWFYTATAETSIVNYNHDSYRLVCSCRNGTRCGTLFRLDKARADVVPPLL